jgi:hypothetical protein
MDGPKFLQFTDGVWNLKKAYVEDTPMWGTSHKAWCVPVFATDKDLKSNKTAPLFACTFYYDQTQFPQIPTEAFGFDDFHYPVSWFTYGRQSKFVFPIPTTDELYPGVVRALVAIALILILLQALSTIIVCVFLKRLKKHKHDDHHHHHPPDDLAPLVRKNRG